MRMKKVESAAALKKMKMPILTPVIGWLLLLLLFCLSHLRVEGQRGFISIDCGLPQASNNTNGVFVYVSDSGFIDSGINKEVNLSLPNIPAIYQTLRSFPIYKRNCYSLPVIQGQKYLVRALFMYGNYDGIGKSPSFDLYLGVDFWDSIKLDNATHIFRTEITAEAPTSSMSLCLVKSGGDVPFISAIELRMVVDGIYTPANRSLSLVTYRRINVGETREMRYPDDPYDRIWTPNYDSYGTPFSTNRTVREERKMRFGLSSAVMRTSVSSSKQIQISWPGGSDASFYIFMDFAELIQLKTTRELMITENGNNFIDSFNPDYLNSMVVYSKGPMNAATYTFLIKETHKSNYGVILNAYEVYKVTQVTGNVTYQSDVDALTSIKEYYKVNRNWIGDPCLPQDFTWDGLTCNYKNFSSPRVDTLDLSNSSLSGTVSKFLDQLTALRTLNLSKNNLQGSIPSFLAQIQNLTNLDLSSNNLSGPIPTLLQEKVNNGALILSTEDNPYICRQEPCNPSRTNNNKKGMIIGIAVGSAVVVATIIFLLIIKERRKNRPGGCFSTQGSRQSEKGSTFSYEEVVKITNNFQKVLGKGGSGTVYHGRLNDGQEVAVKILKGTASQETKEFSAEIKLLMKVHHKYLAQFVGFCDEDKHMILIYEYLPNGNLQQLISGQKVNWKQRLQIALNAATGLEYFHSGCRPPIIHRDVKSSNILLNENMEAKMADFGLSKICATEDVTHISTAIAGTPGYIDPEYYNTNKLTEKSDVYSFGVVLFELISGRHAIIALADQRFHVVQWAVPKIVRGDIVSIVDPKLEGHCINSIWKVAEIAMACAADKAISRPTMTEVVNGLKEALEFETRQSRSASVNIEAPSSSSSSSNPVQSEIYLALNPSER